MTRPPLLNPAILTGPVQPRYALLINPFYPKDPNASFGKHVLTPTLALTSFAATTPEHWQAPLLGREPARWAAAFRRPCPKWWGSPST